MLPLGRQTKAAGAAGRKHGKFRLRQAALA